MRKLICGCACGLISMLANASDSNSDMAKVEQFLDKGGDLYVVSDVQSWSDWRAKSLNTLTSELKAIAMKTPQVNIQMALNLASLTIEELYDISGFEEITAMGESSKYVDSVDGENLFRLKQIHRRNASDESNNLYDAFVSDKGYSLELLANQPIETDFFGVIYLNGEMLFSQISSLTLGPMLLMTADSSISDMAGCSVGDIISSMSGEFSIKMIGDTQYFTFPDNNGNLWKALVNISNTPMLSDLTIAGDKVSCLAMSHEDFNFTATTQDSVVEFSVTSGEATPLSGKTIGESEKYQKMVAQLEGVDSGSAILYSSGNTKFSYSNMLLLVDVKEDYNTMVGVSVDPLSLPFKLLSEMPTLFSAGFWAYFATADFSIPEYVDVDGLQIIIKTEE